MRIDRLLMGLILLICITGCKKDSNPLPSNVINSDFESWSTMDYLKGWKSNSCSACTPPYQTYVVQKTTEAYHGMYAVKLIYNGVYPAVATCKFAVTVKPSVFSGFVKCQLAERDTVSVKVKVFSGSVAIDSAQWINTASIPVYTPFDIHLSQPIAHADSVQVTIRGGNKMDANQNGSVLWIDYLSLK